MNSNYNPAEGKRFNIWSWAVICSAVVLVGYYLLTEHQAHVFTALPWLLILMCPLMHFFMGHGDHGSHKKNHDSKDKTSSANGTIPRQP